MNCLDSKTRGQVDPLPKGRAGGCLVIPGGGKSES